jgi:hypothetical protein
MNVFTMTSDNPPVLRLPTRPIHNWHLAITSRASWTSLFGDRTWHTTRDTFKPLRQSWSYQHWCSCFYFDGTVSPASFSIDQIVEGIEKKIEQMQQLQRQ